MIDYAALVTIPRKRAG